MLTSRHNPERALRLMNEAGVLGRFMPEFGHAVGLMQFNMYHHYTVDEHLIRAVGNVAAIERGEHQGRQSALHRSRQAHPIARSALLRHPAARHRQGLAGRSQRCRRRDRPAACARGWAFRPPTPQAVAWLVKNHLVMSDTAQRRDVSDPKTVRDFVAQVQSPEMLRLLLVLTVADIRAVGPGVWNGWKGQLLRELYYAAEQMMTGGDQTPGARRPRRGGQGRRWRSGWPISRRSSASARCRRHYDNYWLAFDSDEQERHARADAPRPTRAGELLALAAEHQRFPRRHRDRALHPRPSRPVLAIRRRHRHVGRLHRRRQGLHHHRRLRAGCLLGAGRGRRGLRRSASGWGGCARPSRRPCAAKSGRAAR